MCIRRNYRTKELTLTLIVTYTECPNNILNSYYYKYPNNDLKNYVYDSYACTHKKVILICTVLY